MFENRISEQFPFSNSPGGPAGGQAAAASPQIVPLVSVADIYRAASARARYDHELDRLFNPDYYGDHGSGI